MSSCPYGVPGNTPHGASPAACYPLRMEISSASSAAQATEIYQVLSAKKSLNAEQSQVLTLIESAIMEFPEHGLESVTVGKMLDAKA